MRDRFDVLVVGGGVAGVAAALAAAGAGRRVALVRAGPGATALCAGAWRGPMPQPLVAALAGAGHAHEPVEHPLPHPTGELLRADAAPAEHRAARLTADTLVCGITGLPGFRAQALARLWGAASGAPIHSATIDMGDVPLGGWSTPSLAAAIERDPKAIADAVAGAVRARSIRRVILPPVLGIDRAADVRREIEATTGVEIAESLAVPPSIPGLRLDRALLSTLERTGVQVRTGRVGAPIVDGNRVLGVRLLAASDPPFGTGGSDSVQRSAPATFSRPAGASDSHTTMHRELHAASIVLATGKFAAGGIVADGAGLREAALGCHVWVERDGRIIDAAANPLLATRSRREDPQPLLRAGVRVDASGRPVDRDGRVVYENVFVAGAVLAGCDTAGLGLGHAAESGWAAGLAAAEVAA